MIRADAADPTAHRVDQPTEILDVRFARRVEEHGGAFRQRRCHDGVFGARHGGLVQEDLRAAQATAGPKRKTREIGVDRRAERLEGENVGVEPSSADDVAAGGRRLT